jgi:hypothetical protein
MIDEGPPSGLPFVSGRLSANGDRQAVKGGVASAEGARAEDYEAPASVPLAFTMRGGDVQRSKG